MVGTASFLFLSSEVVCVPRAPPIGAGGAGATTSTARPPQRCLGAGVAATELAREVGQARTHKRLGYLDGPKRSKGCPDQGRSGLRGLVLRDDSGVVEDERLAALREADGLGV